MPSLQHIQSADGLKELGDRRATGLVQELTGLAGARGPFGDAEVMVERMLLHAVRHEQSRRVASPMGRLVAREFEAEAHAVLDAPRCDAGEEDAGGLNVVLDGDWIKSRDNPNGMEAKIGVVYTGVELIGRERRRLVNRRYAATLNGSELLGKLVYAQASPPQAGQQAGSGAARQASPPGGWGPVDRHDRRRALRAGEADP